LFDFSYGDELDISTPPVRLGADLFPAQQPDFFFFPFLSQMMPPPFFLADPPAGSKTLLSESLFFRFLAFKSCGCLTSREPSLSSPVAFTSLADL